MEAFARSNVGREPCAIALTDWASSGGTVSVLAVSNWAYRTVTTAVIPPFSFFVQGNAESQSEPGKAARAARDV
jgi:hypothetical protein